MKMTTGLLCTALITCAFSASPLLAETKTTLPGHIDFGEFTAPKDGRFVEVNIQGNLINMIAKLTEDSEPEIEKILRGLKSIRVNVIGLNDENTVEIKARVKSVRKQLSAHGWERIVTVQDKNEDVGVFMKLKGEESVEGIAVTVLNGDSEAVFVNIVGDIRPEQIAKVGERLNIDPLKKLSHELGARE
jgi:hypothetical protein